MNEPLLSARALTKSYTMGRRILEVLRGVNLDVMRGEFLALRGASGAGKSTLLHLIGGLDTPNAGEIRFAGQNLAAFSEGELTEFRNRRVGFVFQAYHLLPELTALENVCLPARVARVPAGRAEARGRELLARVGLGDRLEHKPFELSGGEQQRVAIARALINEPELLLADEPTGNLDSHTGGEILELLKNLRAKKQTTLVIATHDASVAANAPRVVELVDGQIVRQHETTSKETCMNDRTQKLEIQESHTIPPDLSKSRFTRKNRIATVVGFLGGGVFFVLSIVTHGAVPGGGRGGVIGFIIGYALAWLVLAFVR